MLSVAIMAHPRRKLKAEALYKIINKKLPVTIVYDKCNDEWDTGRRAILAHQRLKWHMVIQDDAVISEHFCDNAYDFIKKVNDCLVSFYFGKGRPHQMDMIKAVEEARKQQADVIETTTLFWGVCIAFPTKFATSMSKIENARPYDNKIGHFFENKGMRVLNTYPSLVDHEDKNSILHSDADCERKAFQYCPYRIEFDVKTVKGL